MRFLCIFAIAVAGLFLFAACNSTDRLPSANSRPTATNPVQTPADGVRRVTVTELQNMLNRNEAFVVDVRTEDSYNAAHIRGARLIPLNDVEKRSGELPKDKQIVFYCS